MKETENNFQTKSMIYKMEKIKKNRKNPNNLQNIQPLEILENFQSNIEKKNKENTKEGFAGLPDEDFEGDDDVNSQNGDVSLSSESLTDFINKIYKNLILVNCYLVFSMTNSIGDYNHKVSKTVVGKDFINLVKDITYIDVNNENNNPFKNTSYNLDTELINDSNIMYQYLCIFEALLCTYLFTIAWYYNLIYNFYINEINENWFDYLNRSYIKENLGPYSDFILFFFGYAFLILEKSRVFFESFLPKMSLKFFNKAFIYILLFILIFIFNHEFLSKFKNFLINMITGNYANLVSIIIAFIIIREYIGSFYSTNSLKDVLSMISPSIFDKIYKFIKEIVRFIVIIFIDIPLGVMLCISYFFFISFFSLSKILLSTEYNNKIIEFIRSDVNDLLNSDPCNVQKTFWDYLKNILLYSSTIIYNYLIFIIIIVYCMYILFQNMKMNKILSIYLHCTHLPFLLFSVIIFFYFLGKLILRDTTKPIQDVLILPDSELFKKSATIVMIILGAILILFIIIAFIVLVTIGVIKSKDIDIPNIPSIPNIPNTSNNNTKYSEIIQQVEKLYNDNKDYIDDNEKNDISNLIDKRGEIYNSNIGSIDTSTAKSNIDSTDTSTAKSNIDSTDTSTDNSYSNTLSDIYNRYTS